jgi:DNA adenine methylase
MSTAAARYGNPKVAPRPFVKWAGGKTQLLPMLLNVFPSSFNRYHEPFLGGGAVFFHLQPRYATLSDINAELITTYHAIRNHVDEVIEALQKHSHSEEYYYKIRAQNPKRLSLVQRAARTLFLNKTCFNGLYRVNKSGQFNVPYGHYEKVHWCQPENLYAVSSVLKKIKIRHENVFDITRRVRKNDLVYFDPPYHPMSHTAKFTSYDACAFGAKEQEKLCALFTHLSKRGVYTVLSNSDTPFIRALYKNFNIQQVSARRAINSKADKRGYVSELIITSY